MSCCKGALCSEKTLLKATYRRLPGGLVVRIRRSHRRGRGSIPRLGRSLLLPEAKFPSRRESIVVVQSRSYDHLCSMHVWGPTYQYVLAVCLAVHTFCKEKHLLLLSRLVSYCSEVRLPKAFFFLQLYCKKKRHICL